MRRPRHALLLLLILGVGFAVPAVTMAAGGGSAGDQQYTDPFGNSNGGHTKTTATSTATPPPVANPPASTPAPTVTAAPAVTTAPGLTTTPTATAATTGQSGRTLPFTGYDARLAVLLGAGLVLGGAGLRIRLRRS